MILLAKMSDVITPSKTTRFANRSFAVHQWHGELVVYFSQRPSIIVADVS